MKVRHIRKRKPTPWRALFQGATRRALQRRIRRKPIRYDAAGLDTVKAIIDDVLRRFERGVRVTRS